MREMGEEYHGREQTWLKHRVLEEYLAAWSHKLGSIRGRAVHLWYVDVFAGPWESQSEARADTSIAIGLRALNEAAQTWAEKGHTIQLHAAFVEKNPRSFQALDNFARAAAGAVRVHTFEGAFGDHVDAIDRLVGRNPAFVFVDPTGWDGAALRYIAKLGRRDRRDVLINVMYDHINRFKDDERDFLRRQMRDFFGLADADLPAGLSEDELMAFYRQRLREQSGVPWVADLAVPVPTKERTKFRLVVAGRHPKVVELFRTVEAKVIGKEAAQVRVDARARADESKSGQMTLLRPPAPPEDTRYADRRQADLDLVRERTLAAIAGGRQPRFEDLWPHLLCEAHLTLGDLKTALLALERDRLLRVIGRGPRERTIKDGHRLASPTADPPAR